MLGFPINHELGGREPVFLPCLPTPVFGNRAYEVNLVVGATFLELVSGHRASVYQMLARKHLALGQGVAEWSTVSERRVSWLGLW
jgi:hypothetical protein